MPSDSVLKPSACSARPGIGSVREVEPSATTSWSYGSSSTRPPNVLTRTTWRDGSAPSTCPSRSSVRRSSSRSGTTTWRGSSEPAAAPGSSGV
jgi:hypothetical protein